MITRDEIIKVLRTADAGYNNIIVQYNERRMELREFLELINPPPVYKEGDKVEYHLEQGLYERWIPATVKNIGPKRVVIVDDHFKLQRHVLVKNLRHKE
jgi:hypothetical protein